jgi:hypothetical protein
MYFVHFISSVAPMEDSATPSIDSRGRVITILLHAKGLDDVYMMVN